MLRSPLNIATCFTMLDETNVVLRLAGINTVSARGSRSLLVRHLEFILEIRGSAQPLHDNIDVAALIEIIRKQPVEARYLDIRDILVVS